MSPLLGPTWPLYQCPVLMMTWWKVLKTLLQKSMYPPTYSEITWSPNGHLTQPLLKSMTKVVSDAQWVTAYGLGLGKHAGYYIYFAYFKVETLCTTPTYVYSYVHR